jgi:hypothetical protein
MATSIPEAGSLELVVPDEARHPVPDFAPPAESRRSSASEYRLRRERRERPFRLAVPLLVVITVVILTVYYYQGAGTPGSTSNSGGGAPAGPGASNELPSVTFGVPIVHNTTCGDGQVFAVETVPWISTNVPLSTATFYLALVETIDGDRDGGPAPAPLINASSMCTGGPPASFPTWYAVLQNPSGANIGYYAYTQGWVMLDPSVTSVVVANGSALVLAELPLPNGLSFALCVYSNIGAPYVSDCAGL